LIRFYWEFKRADPPFFKGSLCDWCGLMAKTIYVDAKDFDCIPVRDIGNLPLAIFDKFLCLDCMESIFRAQSRKGKKVRFN